MTILESQSAVTEAGAVAAITEAATEPKTLDPVRPQGISVPAGATFQVLDLERYLPTPRRAAGTYRPATVASFVDYASNHRDAETTTVWIDRDQNQVAAILDDHAPGAPHWREHRVVLQLLKTPEWTHWTAADGRYMNQEAFAEHLQEGIVEIVEPDAATMLEIAQTIQGKTKADWKSAKRLDNGEVSFAYAEEIQASAGRQGHLEIPSTFTLAISPYYGEQPFQIGARLRYRVREGDLAIGYKLDRPHDVLTLVLHTIATRLRDENGFTNVYMGTAPSA